MENALSSLCLCLVISYQHIWFCPLFQHRQQRDTKTPKRDFTLFGVYRYNPYQIFNMLADGFSLIKEYLCEY